MSTKQSKRTTHRSTAGKKLYAVRDAEGRFEDIQQYERAHRRDVRRASKAEAQAASAQAGKEVARAVRASKTAVDAALNAAAQSVEEIIRAGKRAARATPK